MLHAPPTLGMPVGFHSPIKSPSLLSGSSAGGWTVGWSVGLSSAARCDSSLTQWRVQSNPITKDLKDAK